MKEITVVVQGKIDIVTKDVLENYLNHPRISTVIFSGWSNEVLPFAHPKLVVVYSKDPEKPGIGNRNRQIISSYNGLCFVNTKYAWKVRSDQIYPKEAIDTYLDFFEEKFNERYPQIFTPGLYTKELFHIRDHQTLGTTRMIKEFWQCPLDDYEGAVDYTKCIRAEAYFVCHYLKLYSTAAYQAISNPEIYLLDNAPKRQHMLESSNKIMPKYFVAMPRVNFHWPKHYPGGYPYELVSQLHGEYWSNNGL